jgi:chain length determinant protein EpsF
MPQQFMSLQQILLILRSRWRLAAGIFAGIFIPILIVNLILPKQYMASASVVVDLRPDPVAGQVSAAQALPQYMATQVDIVGSPRVARRVVKLLQLDQSPDYQQRWQKAAQGRGDLIDWIATGLKRKLAVQPSGESNVINISVTWPEAKGAATLANAFAQAYVDTTIELTVEPAKQYASSFGDRASVLRADLEAKQKLLSDFESQTGIIATDEHLDVEQSRLAELSTQLVAIQGLRQDSQSRERQADSDKDAIPELLQSPLISSLKADLSRAEAKQDDIATRLGTNHPEYKSTEAEVTSLRARIAREGAMIIASLTGTTRVNLRREKDITAALEAQKERIIELKHQHDQAQVLQNDVLTAQRNLDAVTQRLAQSTLEGQTQQTNLAILTRATEPLEQKSPKILLNCMLAALAGAALGVGAALLRERSDQRIRIDAELAHMLGVPVLGRILAVTSQSQSHQAANRALPHIASQAS